MVRGCYGGVATLGRSRPGGWERAEAGKEGRGEERREKLIELEERNKEKKVRVGRLP